jgi:hypothetical protein
MLPALFSLGKESRRRAAVARNVQIHRGLESCNVLIFKDKAEV